MMSSLFLKIHTDAIGKAKTILDVGCGTGDFMVELKGDKKWEITGIDIHEKSLQDAKKQNVYTKLLRGSVNKVLAKLIKNNEKYDVIFCSQLIEHVSKKEGEKMLALFEKLAKKRIIVCTPKGYLEQPYEHELHRNHYQEHKSGWEICEFLLKKYNVYGVGLSVVWGEKGLGRSKNMLVAIVAQFVSFLCTPVTYYQPAIAAGLLCVKEIP